MDEHRGGCIFANTRKITDQILYTYVYIFFIYSDLKQYAYDRNSMSIHLGGNNSISGLLFGLFMAAAILFRPLFGTLIDDKSRRMVLIVGCIISTVISLSYVFAFSIAILLFVRSLHGIGFSATTNASGTIVSDIVPRNRLAMEGVGYFGLSITLATAVRPTLSLLLIQHFNYNALFLGASLISFIALCCGFFIDYEKKKPEPDVTLTEKKRNEKSLKSCLRKAHCLCSRHDFYFYRNGCHHDLYSNLCFIFRN